MTYHRSIRTPVNIENESLVASRIKIKSLLLESKIFPNPNRFNIIAILILMGPINFNTLHEISNLTRGNLGYYLAQLQDLGWVKKQTKKNHQQYTVTSNALFELMTSLKEFSLLKQFLLSALQKSDFNEIF